MSPWLKAGLVGAVVLVVLNLLGLIPCVGLITCILGLFAYVAIGALAAYWMPPIRMAGPAAGQGALAAGLAAVIGGIVNAIVMLIRTAIVGSAEILSQIPPETLRQLEQAGVDPQMFRQFVGPGGALLGGSICCIGGLILAVILGAIGGAAFAAIQQD
ncbi:MAG: hypothetical protein PVH17_00740 [Anaerolineae bacterium]